MNASSHIADVDRVTSVFPASPLFANLPMYAPLPDGALADAPLQTSSDVGLATDCVEEAARMLMEIDCSDLTLKQGYVLHHAGQCWHLTIGLALLSINPRSEKQTIDSLLGVQPAGRLCVRFRRPCCSKHSGCTA